MIIGIVVNILLLVALIFRFAGLDKVFITWIKERHKTKRQENAFNFLEKIWHSESKNPPMTDVESTYINSVTEESAKAIGSIFNTSINPNDRDEDEKDNNDNIILFPQKDK